MSESGSGDPTTPNGAEGRDASARVRPPIRAIDPATAKRLVGAQEGEAPRPALYLTNRLLVRGLVQGPEDSSELNPRLARDLAALDLRFAVTPPRKGQQAPRSSDGEQDGGTEGESDRVTSITLHPTDPINAVDAWAVLQQLRQADPYWIEHASLEHVIRPADGYWGGIGGYWGGIGGYWGGIDGYWGGIGGSPLEEYAMPGRGGRMPVALALPDPALRARPLDRTPVVALPDTQITAAHPWFADPKRVVRTALEGGELVVVDPTSAPESPASPPVEQVPKPVDPAALLGGHGTFIAGLIRQGCPEATILSLPVMGDDGVVEEGDLLLWLEALLEMHQRGQRGAPGGMVIDVLSLSMGYYAEDQTYKTGPVADLLSRFARCGVAVVAGAGNDGSRDPFVPASLAAPTPRGRISPSSTPPVASVGACNPDGTTVALFSNDLELISAVRQGVSVVSTLPLTNGMGQPSTRIVGDTGVRCTVDPDDYTGGFGVWSGTSFATPVFAAQVAAALVAEGDLTDVTDRAMRRRSIRALRTCIPEEKP